MSWIARSLVNSFRGDDDHGSQQEQSMKQGNKESTVSQVHSDEEPLSPGRSVKEDLSELTKTISRQFWGVASFLAPPPDIPSDRGHLLDPSDSAASGSSDDLEVTESPRITGIRSDFAELGGRFKSGISMLSNTKAVSEISKIASTFLPFGDGEADEEEGEPGDEAVGITDDVLLFVRNISMHPETWLDFPLIDEDEECDDFKMSDAQQEHGLAVERLEPRLAALRIELCPTHMSEGCFWKIYFVLLHSRLNNHDAEILSTPQIVRARAMLLQDLHSRKKTNPDELKRNQSSRKDEMHDVPSVPDEAIVIAAPVVDTVSSRSSPSTPSPIKEISTPAPISDIVTEKYPVETTVLTIVDKSVTEEDLPVPPKSKDLQPDVTGAPKHNDEDNEDDWLDDEAGEASSSGENALPLGNDIEVSFSDLEEDDEGEISKPSLTQVKETRSWVQLKNDSGSPAKGSGLGSRKNKDDWLNVGEVDVD